MSETTIEAILKALAQWPLAEVVFIVLITCAGLWNYRKGERDRKSIGPGSVEIPMWAMAGPLADMFRRVEAMADDGKEQTELLRATVNELRTLVNELRRQNELMEWIGNQAGMQDPPKPPRRRN